MVFDHPNMPACAKEDINLLKAVAAASSEKPFSRGSPAWNTVLLTLATNYDAKWKPVSIRPLRNRTHFAGEGAHQEGELEHPEIR